VSGVSDEVIPVDAVIIEKTHVGKVNFPATVPEQFYDLIRFPDDLYENLEKMGLTKRVEKFLLAALNGKWSLTAGVDLQDIAIKTGMQYSEMDSIIRDLLDKNYARLDKRLDLYRFWVVLLHVKGIEFDVAKD
jgi:hypothetical protein